MQSISIFSVGANPVPTNYEKIELTDVTPTANNEHSTITSYGPYYNCRVNMTIHSFDGSHMNVFEIGDGTKLDRHPALYVSPGGGVYAHSYGAQAARNMWVDLETPIIIEMKQFEDNGVVRFTFTYNEIERMTYANTRESTAVKSDMKVFISNNFNVPADVTIHTFFFEVWS